jgi:hypothetical protein
MTELERARLPILEAREKNRAKKGKTMAALEEKFNKKLRRLNRAIQAGVKTEKELKESEKMLK